MARVVRQPRIRERDGTKIRFSELIVIVIILAAITMAGRYYFFVYRASPGYALAEYLGAVKKGDVSQQYAMLDDEDRKRFFPTEAEYEKGTPIARGYAARVSNVQVSAEKINTKTPDVATVEATVSIRGLGNGSLIQGAEATDYNNSFVLRKNGSGQWKLLLSQSAPTMRMLQAPPNPPGSSF